MGHTVNAKLFLHRLRDKHNVNSK